jgi:hypothetical protein
MEEKEAGYRKCLQNKRLECYIEYKTDRAIVRKMTQRQGTDAWGKFVKTVERKITGTQTGITGT